MCCTPAAELSASRSSTLNSRRACRLASCRGDWRRSSGFDGTVGFPCFLDLVLAYRLESDLVLLDLTVKARTINAKHICSFLLVATRSLQGALDYKLLNFFERHVGRHVPGRYRRGCGGRAAVIEGEIDRLNALTFGQQHCAFDDVLQLAHVAGPRV